MEKIRNYIGGELVDPAGGKWLENVDPSTGRAYSLVPDSDERDVAAAVAAAQQAFPAWSQTPAEQRARMLMKLGDLVERDLEKLALAECIDNGKPITRARTVDLPRAVKNFRFFASMLLHESTQAHVVDRDAINYTLRRPRGVAGLISPWNLPLYILTWKVAPALATGNTAVAKPSEVTPMTAYLFAQLCREAGLPPGVLNIVHGLGSRAGAALVGDPRVPTISFTGGTKTGQDISRATAASFKKLSLELGGKNPNVVFADADISQAVETSVQAAFGNQGQICLCGSRLLVERSIYDQFLEKFLARTAALKLGDPLDPAVEQGAMVSKPHFEKTVYYVGVAREEGGKVHCGGAPARAVNERCREGYFYQPTVVSGLGPECRTNQEEIFGPVVSILPFADEREAVEIANGTAYGLSASLWTRDLSRAHRVADQIAAGSVWVNCWMLRDLRVPFGGVKQSGVGREGGEEALRFYTEPKNVCVKL